MPATGSRAACRSSTSECADQRALRWRSRCLTATPATGKCRYLVSTSRDPERADPHRPMGDRRMLTSARIRDELRPALRIGSARCAPTIRVLVNDGALQLSLSMSRTGRDHHPDYAGERLVCCHNPALADERAANATSCWRPPKKNCRPSPRPPAVSAGRCAAKTRSRCGWARCATSSGGQALHLEITDEALTSPATRTASPPRPPWTASTCAPSRPNTPWAATTSCCATRTSPTSNGPHTNSERTCAPSGIAWPTGCARTYRARCPTTSAGT